MKSALLILALCLSHSLLSQNVLLNCAFKKAKKESTRSDKRTALITVAEAYMDEKDSNLVLEIFNELMEDSHKLEPEIQNYEIPATMEHFVDFLPASCLTEYKRLFPDEKLNFPLNKETISMALKYKIKEHKQRHYRYEYMQSYDPYFERKPNPAKDFCTKNRQYIYILRDDLKKSNRTKADFDRYIHMLHYFPDTNYFDEDSVEHQCVNLTVERLYGYLMIHDFKSAIHLLDSTKYKLKTNMPFLVLSREGKKADLDDLAKLIQRFDLIQFNGVLLPTIISRIEREELDYSPMKHIIIDYGNYLMEGKRPTDTYDRYRFEDEKMKVSMAHLWWGDHEKALLLAKSISNHEKRSKCYLRIGQFWQKQENKASALEYFEKALKAIRKEDIDNFAVNQVGRIAKAYFNIGNQEKAKELLRESEKMCAKIRSEYFIQASLEDVAIDFAELGWYKEAMGICFQLGNGGSSSIRSSAEEKVYEKAFQNGDTLDVLALLELATVEIDNIGHIYQRQWYRRQAAIAWARLGEYNRALKVANQLETNSFDYALEFTEGFIEAYESREKKPVPMVYMDSLIQFAGNEQLNKTDKLYAYLIDYYFDKFENGNIQEFEKKILQSRYQTTDVTKIKVYKTAFYLFHRTGNEAAALKITQRLARYYQRVKNLIELHQIVNLYKFELNEDYFYCR